LSNVDNPPNQKSYPQYYLVMHEGSVLPL
jgi:hypothetical protein